MTGCLLIYVRILIIRVMESKEKTRELLGAIQTNDLERATEILNDIIEDKQEERYGAAYKALEEG